MIMLNVRQGDDECMVNDDGFYFWTFVGQFAAVQPRSFVFHGGWTQQFGQQGLLSQPHVQPLRPQQQWPSRSPRTQEGTPSQWSSILPILPIIPIIPIISFVHWWKWICSVFVKESLSLVFRGWIDPFAADATHPTGRLWRHQTLVCTPMILGTVI